MKWKFIFGRQQVSEHDTFKEAVQAMAVKVKEEFQKGLTYQVLESTVWIQPDKENDAPIMFYVARDIGAENGWFDFLEK